MMSHAKFRGNKTSERGQLTKYSIQCLQFFSTEYNNFGFYVHGTLTDTVRQTFTQRDSISSEAMDNPPHVSGATHGCHGTEYYGCVELVQPLTRKPRRWPVSPSPEAEILYKLRLAYFTRFRNSVSRETRHETLCNVYA